MENKLSAKTIAKARELLRLEAVAKSNIAATKNSQGEEAALFAAEEALTDAHALQYLLHKETGIDWVKFKLDPKNKWCGLKELLTSSTRA